MNLHKVFLLLGSNLGDREQMLQSAEDAITGHEIETIQRSGLYETAAWGITDQPAFLNQVLEVETKLDPEALMQTLLEIEQSLGRERKERYGPRSIDIDILFFDTLVYHSSVVTIPHPAMQERKFVLKPLAELAPDLIHPVFHQSVQELLSQCKDELPVKKIS